MGPRPQIDIFCMEVSTLHSRPLFNDTTTFAASMLLTDTLSCRVYRTR